MSILQTEQNLSVEALIGQVADEFTQRLNRGDQPDIDEYAARYPQIAPLLREVLTALQLIRGPAVQGTEAEAAAPNLGTPIPAGGKSTDICGHARSAIGS